MTDREKSRLAETSRRSNIEKRRANATQHIKNDKPPRKRGHWHGGSFPLTKPPSAQSPPPPGRWGEGWAPTTAYSLGEAISRVTTTSPAVARNQYHIFVAVIAPGDIGHTTSRSLVRNLTASVESPVEDAVEGMQSRTPGESFFKE